MQKYKSNITTTSGAAIRGVPVLVIDEDGNNAALFLDRAGTVPAPNPLTTGPDGVFYFYAVNGRYSIRTTVDGVTITDDDVVLMMDPEEITVAGPIAEAVAAAQAAATAAEFAVEASGIPELVSAAQNAVVDANNAASQASTAASNAATSKTGADSARDAAVIAKNAAEAALASFDDRYLGQKPANPAQDNDGGALLVGALYFRTTAPIGMKVWTGTAWDDAYANLSSKFDKTGGDIFGNVNVPSLNGGQLAGMRNKIINGDFSINQRTYASGTATTAGQYTFDRWKVTGTQSITFSTAANKTTVTIPAGQKLQQVIEGLNLQSGTYVLSWEGTAQGRIGAGAYGASGTVTAAITGGANTTIEFNAGTVTNVQLEPGSVATPFEHRQYGVELVLCKRYWQRYVDLLVGGLAIDTFARDIYVSFALPEMRAIPTITFSGTRTTNASSPTINRNFTNHLRLAIATGGSAGVSFWQGTVVRDAEL